MVNEMRSHTELAKGFLEADLKRRQACAVALETDNCHYCPLEALNKCVWKEQVGETNIAESEYVMWLEFIDDVSRLGTDYKPLPDKMAKWLEGIDDKRW